MWICLMEGGYMLVSQDWLDFKQWLLYRHGWTSTFVMFRNMSRMLTFELFSVIFIFTFIACSYFVICSLLSLTFWTSDLIIGVVLNVELYTNAYTFGFKVGFEISLCIWKSFSFFHVAAKSSSCDRRLAFICEVIDPKI